MTFNVLELIRTIFSFAKKTDSYNPLRFILMLKLANFTKSMEMFKSIGFRQFGKSHAF